MIAGGNVHWAQVHVSYRLQSWRHTSQFFYSKPVALPDKTSLKSSFYSESRREYRP